MESSLSHLTERDREKERDKKATVCRDVIDFNETHPRRPWRAIDFIFFCLEIDFNSRRKLAVGKEELLHRLVQFSENVSKILF